MAQKPLYDVRLPSSQEGKLIMKQSNDLNQTRLDENFKRIGEMMSELYDRPSGGSEPVDVPTKLSELENDTGFITEASVPTKVSQLENDAGFITGVSETWEKIWDNPSPASSFASQTISIADLAHCTKVYVQFNYTNSDQSTGGGCLIPYVGGDDVVGGQGVSVGSSYYYVRGVRINWGANTVQFMGGYRGTTAGNNYCIPRCIYGVKGR